MIGDRGADRKALLDACRVTWLKRGMSKIPVDPARFLSDLHMLRSFGGDSATKGVRRRALTEADIAARD